MAEWLNEAKAIDTAVYEAIAAGRTPALDVAMRRLSQAADHSVLWLATAAALALLGGPGGRRAARRGLASLGLASTFANLVAKPLTTLDLTRFRGHLTSWEQSAPGRSQSATNTTALPAGVPS